MTEIGEGVALDRINVDHDSGSCPFCQQTSPAVVVNVLAVKYDEDAAAARDDEQWVRFERAADSLGGRLEKPSVSGLRRVGSHYESGDDLPIGLVPHHLIPGPDALLQSTLATSGLYLRVDGSAIGNCGYDMNEAANGAWVPSNYAYRPWGPGGSIFSAREGLPAQAYCSAAIAVCQAQFHDAHESYAEIVRDALDRLHAEVQHHAVYVCPHADGLASHKWQCRS